MPRRSSLPPPSNSKSPRLGCPLFFGDYSEHCPGACRSREAARCRRAHRLVPLPPRSRERPDLLLPAFADVTRTFQSASGSAAGTGDHRFVDDLKRSPARCAFWMPVECGFLGGQEREAAYRDADLFVLPSYSENFGMAAAEAMAHRLLSS
ncbi:MAG: glycosyltransferase [Bryobacteraceae bacterium]